MPSLQDIPAMARHASISALPDVRSHLPDFDFADMRSKLDEVRSRFSDLDFHQPLSYIPVLSDRLQSLHSHLSSMELPSGIEMPSLAPGTVLSDLLEALLSSDPLSELLPLPEAVVEGEDMLERAAKEVTVAVKRSLEGARLIQYADLPEQWKNNPFVANGYR
jgi:adiponectin receptor